MRLAIKDFLLSDETGLPVDRYDEDEVVTRADEVYRHVYRVYLLNPSPYHESRSSRSRVPSGRNWIGNDLIPNALAGSHGISPPAVTGVSSQTGQNFKTG